MLDSGQEQDGGSQATVCLPHRTAKATQVKLWGESVIECLGFIQTSNEPQGLVL